MTWGEIRAELTERFPGFSLDLLDSFIRKSYREILDSREWSRLTGDANILTVAQYSEETVSLTNGSNVVTGSGTAFTAAMAGRRFHVIGSSALYTFTYVSATSGTLDRDFEGETGTDLAYEIFQDTYQLGSGIEYANQVLNPWTGRPLEQTTISKMREMVNAAGPWIGDPTHWAPDSDTSEDNPTIYQRIRLWPAPETAASLPYGYKIDPNEFDGSNTSTSPLPWVSSAAITAAAAVRVLKHMKDYTGAAAERAEYDDSLSSINLIEDNRVPGPTMRIADRFVPRTYRPRWWR